MRTERKAPMLLCWDCTRPDGKVERYALYRLDDQRFPLFQLCQLDRITGERLHVVGVYEQAVSDGIVHRVIGRSDCVVL